MALPFDKDFKRLSLILGVVSAEDLSVKGGNVALTQSNIGDWIFQTGIYDFSGSLGNGLAGEIQQSRINIRNAIPLKTSYLPS